MVEEREKIKLREKIRGEKFIKERR